MHLVFIVSQIFPLAQQLVFRLDNFELYLKDENSFLCFFVC